MERGKRYFERAFHASLREVERRRVLSRLAAVRGFFGC